MEPGVRSGPAGMRAVGRAQKWVAARVGRGLRSFLPLSLLLATAACAGKPGASESLAAGTSTTDPATTGENPASTARNAGYAGVRMLSPHSGCTFLSSPINFCDDRHRAEINKVIAEQRPNFNGHYIVAELEEWPEYFQRSVVVINARSGVVYPVPIDALSGALSSRGRPMGHGTLETSVDAQQFCLLGTILAYRSINEGRFCFGFDGVRFTGYQTAYMVFEAH